MSANDNVTWRGLIPSLVTTAAKAPTKEARDFAMGQLLLLGEIVDRHIANLSVLAQSLPAPTEDTTGIIPAPPAQWPECGTGYDPCPECARTPEEQNGEGA